MGAWSWVMLIAVIIIVVLGVLALVRRARRSGSVLAASSDKKGRR